MTEDRRAANAWAMEWQIKQKNRRIILTIVAILLIIAICFGIKFITVHATRTTYGSEEEMRAALQGRFETDYCEDIEIIGDDLILTYYEISHYDVDYAEKYGYSQYDDSVYEDTVAKWDYRNGVIKMNWMSEIKVDKDGNLVYYDTPFQKTDAEKPIPFDPSILNKDSAEETPEAELSEEEQEAAEAAQESLEETEKDSEAFAAEASEGV